MLNMARRMLIVFLLLSHVLNPVTWYSNCGDLPPTLLSIQLLGRQPMATGISANSQGGELEKNTYIVSCIYGHENRLVLGRFIESSHTRKLCVAIFLFYLFIYLFIFLNLNMLISMQSIKRYVQVVSLCWSPIFR